MLANNVPDANTAIAVAHKVEDVEKGAVKEVVQGKAAPKAESSKKDSKSEKVKKPSIPNAPYWTLFSYLSLFVSCGVF